MKSPLPDSSSFNVINKPERALWSRRSNLKVIGLLPFMGGGSHPSLQLFGTDPSCTLAPQMAEGPYWIDARRNRASLAAGTTRNSVVNGTTMSLTIHLYDNKGPICGSTPAHDVQVDIWHCDAHGLYSGMASSNTLGEDFLRGYQVTNSEGRVTFTTIYPGWHEGRATHICLRARVYDSLGNTTYNFVSRLFFDDGFTDEIYLMAPYNLRGSRDTRNNSDVIYRGANTPPLVTAEYTTAETGTELVAEVAIGLPDLPVTRPHRHCA